MPDPEPAPESEPAVEPELAPACEAKEAGASAGVANNDFGGGTEVPAAPLARSVDGDGDGSDGCGPGRGSAAEGARGMDAAVPGTARAGVGPAGVAAIGLDGDVVAAGADGIALGAA